MKSKISVIVPVYNAERYIGACIDSMINQTYADLEIILADDGSTDASGAICDAYAKKDARIKVLHGSNAGSVKARKIALEAATGNLIAFVDADDWLEPDMLERLYNALVRENVDIAMCGRFEDVGGVSREVYHGIPEGRYGKKELVEKVYPRMIVNGAFFEWGLFPGLWDKLFRRECIERFLFDVDDRINMGGDASCVYPCLLNADSIYVLHECLYHYRQTTDSLVKKIKKRELEREQFHTLYQTVRDVLGKYRDIYDLTKQWAEYVLFLMTPRADALYRGYEDLDYLFPFPQVKKGFRIVLYGAGTYGQRLYRFLKRTGFCEVVLWVDRNFAELKGQGLEVEPPQKVPSCQYDAIVIANTYAKSRAGLYNELLEKYPGKTVCQIDEALILSEESRRAFGLEEV